VAVIDFDAGAVVRTHNVCAPREVPMSLALAPTPRGPVVYVGLWRPVAPVGSPWRPAGGRVLALDAQTGATTAVLPLVGLPDALVVGTGPVGSGPESASRLYCVEAPLPADEDGTPPLRRDGAARGWRLWGADPTTLDVASEQVVRYPPIGLTVAPDGRQAYAVVQPVDGQFLRALLRLDLVRGTETLLARVPGSTGTSLAVTDARVYVPNPEGNAVWVADRQGRPLQAIPVRGHPLGIALSGAG
jgi:DNA-binding beta-propeller fold protein YncE